MIKMVFFEFIIEATVLITDSRPHFVYTSRNL